ncbi:ABC transporter ATP-binding protein [Pseudanabaena galeata UHCC 0370]|jgi:spermidine/putrescine transport system ATP-binding protein|uniref:Spermidine/putrescine import ATP-binding protein PotA n=1 Tax=Pseudanabaena galeata UHCC 0370 TaxID=3110310 RepID=A0ABU5TDB1_9CYAN|nr:MULTISPECIES: ABC transporter ATP-binding protein [Pseudanabaena]MEA5476260.1 ABC transporter ATP-binding protein [Pseudanabaena galeata UHCC 0370]MEA5488489.1 ABC transporter ATP-binding protein [Pseudanabaena sp. CCNP1317]WGS74291.1 ABC transporter ATP-binding protein [Pseudanabaena galeata CCNP1313]
MAQSTTAKQFATPTGTVPDVELQRVFKMFGTNTVVQGVDLQVQRGELFSILGPSGCGKTTLLRLVAGFEEPSAGEVLIQGNPMTYIPAYQRPVNTVFQSYALFGHMTIFDNVAFGLSVKGVPKPEIQQRAKDALKQVRLDHMSDRYPSQISGGQQQRVALARALVNRPKVILLDEPLAALDFKLRKELQVELSNLQYELGISFIMVTHDQSEALAISSRIAVMNQGRIEQIGTPSEVYDRPSSAFVADFVGETNLFECRVIEQDGAFVELRSSTGLAIVAAKPRHWLPIPEAVVSVRPEKIKLSTEYPNQPYNTYRGILNNVLYLGDHSQFVVDLHASENVPPVRVMLVRSNHQGERTPPFDSQVYVSWMPEDCVALPKTTVAT